MSNFTVIFSFGFVTGFWPVAYFFNPRILITVTTKENLKMSSKDKKEVSLDEIVSLCKRRGFIYQGQ